MIFSACFSANAQDACFDCHQEGDLSKIDASGREISLYVDSKAFARSVHGEFQCVDCHSDAEEIPHAETLEKVDCAMCHDLAFEAYESSVHGKSRLNGGLEAASCVDCHGKHDILPSSNPASKSHPLNLAMTCAVCHADPKIVKKYDFPIANPLGAYQKSVHGVAVLSEQKFDAATCSSCHGSHDIRPMSDPESRIYWRHVPETCGECHADVMEQYFDSVHWKAAKRGVRDAPICTDCHGEHEVKSHNDPKSPVHPLRVSQVTCERCHASEMLAGKYGIAESRVATYEDSYHGLAIQGGSIAAANCASCHGIHSILPSSDPKSLIHPANLQKTCGSCHKGATKNFASGPVHLTTSTTPGRVVQYVQTFYIWLIVIVIGAMILHNGADFIGRSRRTIAQRDKT